MLYHLYAGHPINMNPFRSAFVEVFNLEKEKATSQQQEDASLGGREQLVWVLWKILRGDGFDVSL